MREGNPIFFFSPYRIVHIEYHAQGEANIFNVRRTKVARRNEERRLASRIVSSRGRILTAFHNPTKLAFQTCIPI